MGQGYARDESPSNMKAYERREVGDLPCTTKFSDHFLDPNRVRRNNPDLDLHHKYTDGHPDNEYR